MKKMVKMAVVIACFLMYFGSFALAQTDHSKHPQGTDQTGHDSHSSPAMNHDKPMGTSIGDRSIQDFMFSYYLLNKEERDQMMKGHEGMEMPGMMKSPDVTNHLMVYIKGSEGNFASGKIGFIVAGPDGKEFKTLTMGMYNGYGADLIIKDKGVYKIKTKAVIENKTLLDEFDYEVK
jgi:hypothetical protein